MADTTKYVEKTISNNPADYITGPRRGQVNRTHGGTTQDGSVQVLKPEDDGEE